LESGFPETTFRETNIAQSLKLKEKKSKSHFAYNLSPLKTLVSFETNFNLPILHYINAKKVLFLSQVG
jgi:hypothetical protein